MTIALAILALHALSTLMMTGLIWFVQIVHYPLMQMVGEQNWVEYEREHMRRTTWIVAPLMCVEAVSAAMLLTLTTGGLPHYLGIAGLMLVGLIWACTAGLQVPCHRRLSAGFDGDTARRLVATNWIRTAAWTMRALIAISVPFAIPGMRAASTVPALRAIAMSLQTEVRPQLLTADTVAHFATTHFALPCCTGVVPSAAVHQ